MSKAKKARKLGRPPAGEEKRIIRLTIVFSPKEAAPILASAQASNLPPAVWARQALILAAMLGQRRETFTRSFPKS